MFLLCASLGRNLAPSVVLGFSPPSWRPRAFVFPGGKVRIASAAWSWDLVARERCCLPGNHEECYFLSCNSVSSLLCLQHGVRWKTTIITHPPNFCLRHVRSREVLRMVDMSCGAEEVWVDGSVVVARMRGYPIRTDCTTMYLHVDMMFV